MTALVAQDCLGGEILKTSIPQGWHFYNRIDDDIVDFTAEQFETLPSYAHVPASREEAFADTSAEQYADLKAAFDRLWSDPSYPPIPPNGTESP